MWDGRVAGREGSDWLIVWPCALACIRETKGNVREKVEKLDRKGSDDMEGGKERKIEGREIWKKGTKESRRQERDWRSRRGKKRGGGGDARNRDKRRDGGGRKIKQEIKLRRNGGIEHQQERGGGGS